MASAPVSVNLFAELLEDLIEHPEKRSEFNQDRSGYLAGYEDRSNLSLSPDDRGLLMALDLDDIDELIDRPGANNRVTTDANITWG